MSPVVKGVAGVGVPAAGVGGAYLYLKHSDQEMPAWNPIKNSETSKFGKDFQPYLVDKDDESNEKWWEWSYRNGYRKEDENLSTGFKNLETLDAFKSACDTNYKKTTSEIIPTGSDAEKEKQIKDIWRFCSPLGAKPKTIADNKDGTDSSFLADGGAYKSNFGETKKDELVSVNYDGNENKEFWKLKEKLFFGEGTAEGIGNHTKETNKRNLFDLFYASKNNRQETLKQKCDEAYRKKTETGDTAVKETDVLKYCGLKVVSS